MLCDTGMEVQSVHEDKLDRIEPGARLKTFKKSVLDTFCEQCESFDIK